MNRGIMCWTMVVLLWGCGAAQPSKIADLPGTMGEDNVDGVVSDLRKQQEQRLWQFDRNISASGGECDALCEHHTQICKLATRICKIADQYPEHHRAKNACAQANETCRQTNERLPNECWCSR